jgi:glycerol transport system permease protein
VAFSAILPLMTVVNYSVQDIVRKQQVLLERRRLVLRIARSIDRLGARACLAWPQLLFSAIVLAVEVPLGIWSRCPCRAKAGASRLSGDSRCRC